MTRIIRLEDRRKIDDGRLMINIVQWLFEFCCCVSSLGTKGRRREEGNEIVNNQQECGVSEGRAHNISRMSMQAEKPGDPTVEEEKERDDDDEEEEQEEGPADGAHVLLLASNDSNDEPMMKAYAASLAEKKEKENVGTGYKHRGNNGYGLDYSPDGLLPGQEPLAFAQPSQASQVFLQQPMQATHHPTTGSLLPVQRGLLQRPMVMPPKPLYAQHCWL
jgi:hypothetical protein